MWGVDGVKICGICICMLVLREVVEAWSDNKKFICGDVNWLAVTELKKTGFMYLVDVSGEKGGEGRSGGVI